MNTRDQHLLAKTRRYLDLMLGYIKTKVYDWNDNRGPESILFCYNNRKFNIAIDPNAPDTFVVYVLNEKELQREPIQIKISVSGYPDIPDNSELKVLALQRQVMTHIHESTLSENPFDLAHK